MQQRPSLQKTRDNAMSRFIYLQRQLGKDEITLDAAGIPVVEQSQITQVQGSLGFTADEDGLALIQSEVNQLNWLNIANNYSIAAGISRLTGSVLHVLSAAGVADPTGTAYKVLQASAYGASGLGDSLGTLASNANTWGQWSGLIAGWQRRRDEWVQQSKMTVEEIRQIDKQIVALEIRKSIAEKELDNHRQQIEHTREIDDYIRTQKFTRESLYTWMESQLSSIYFSAYQLAYEQAKRAERAYRFELGDESTNFVQYGHWDSMRKGLMAGELLAQDLRRMEVAYLDRNRRELEITRHVSLLQLDPIALVKLRQTASCEITIPEELLDMEFPGHFFRRLKTVSISVPCVVGSYTNVSGTLTLLSSKIRDAELVKGGSYSAPENYRASYLPIQSIATSTGQNDSGLFELNFRDERYLPFEGAGAISTWKFSLPQEFRQFDYDTISDVIIHLRYTARDKGSLKEEAIKHLNDYIGSENSAGSVRLFSIRHEFPTEWAKFKSPKNVTATNRAALTLNPRSEHYPFWSQGHLGVLNRVDFFAETVNTVDISTNTNGTDPKDSLDGTLGNLKTGKLTNIPLPDPICQFTLYFNDNLMEDLWLAVTWGKTS
jgi:Tc toxin complex TcA C-terminal TcB-binding domain